LSVEEALVTESFGLENSASDPSAVGDEFLALLYKGGELLAGGKVIEAKEVLERAFELQPKNPKGQNLLGLTYFKLGLYDRAAEVYDLLVRDNPIDPTLRVNLGLVYLKTGAIQQAIRELETAVELKHDHKKAHNYLGLAYAQAGDYARARECFINAGSAQMVEKMDRAISERSPAIQAAALAEDSARAVASEPAQIPGSNGDASSDASPERQSESDWGEAAGPPTERFGSTVVDAPAYRSSTDDDSLATTEASDDTLVGDAEAEQESTEESPTDQTEVPIEVETSAPVASDLPGPGSEEEVAATPVETPERKPTGVEPAHEEWTATPPASAPKPVAIPMLADLTAALRLPPTIAGVPFEVTPEVVVVRVDGQVHSRLEGMLGLHGSVKCRGVMKRFRGRPTDKPFGEGERRMVVASGRGAILVAPRGRVFVPFDLAEESAYFREDVVFAFEEAVIFENGRVPSKIAPDLHLVHLSGKGKALLCLPGAMRSAEVHADEPYTVPMSMLAGWHGTITPKIVGVLDVDDAPASMAAVELTGEGFAILA
jgi:Flp pilus assembly protein TadD/uncharacterized protein (AIM24 family)